MKKRAMSEIVSTVLIIMISVVAVGILSAVMIPLVKTNLSFNSACSTAGSGIYLDSIEGYSCLDKNNEILSVNIKKKDLDLNISRVKLNVFSDDGSHSYYINLPERFSGRIFYLNVSGLNDLEKVEVYPIVSLGNKNRLCDSGGSIKVSLCSSDVSYLLEEIIEEEGSSSQNNNGGSGGNTGGSGSSGGNSEEDNGEDSGNDKEEDSCVPDCGCAENTLVGETCSDRCGGFCEGKNNLLSGLIAYYGFNEESGTTAIDSMEGVGGIISEGVLVNQSGVIGKSYRFDGTNKENIVLFSRSLPLKKSYTVSMWFKPFENYPKGEIGTLFDTWGGNYHDGVLTIRTNETTNLYHRGYYNGNFYPTNSITLFSSNKGFDNSWNHVILTYNSNSVTFYLNGIDVGSIPVSGEIYLEGVSSGFIVGCLGRIDCQTNFFRGYLDELGIWDRSLSSEEIGKLYNSGRGLAFPFV